MGKGPDVTYFIELFAPQDVAKKPKSPKKKKFLPVMLEAFTLASGVSKGKLP